MTKAKIEFEAKILNIDIHQLEKKIIKIGGEKIATYNFRRYVFDINPVKKGVWLRLRSNGSESTLTLKDIASDAIDGTTEIEVVVSDFDATLEILSRAGLKPKSYQENTRHLFSLQDAELALDEWPKLNPYLEIEAEDEHKVRYICSLLGYDSADLTSKNTDKLYLEEGIDLDRIKELKF